MENPDTPKPSGAPAGYVEGIFLDFTCGSDGGGCGIVIRKRNGSDGTVLSDRHGQIVVDGQVAQCVLVLGSRGLPQCHGLPPTVVSGKIRVRIPYWWWYLKGVAQPYPYTDRFATTD